MVIKVYVSGISGNKEVKKRQQRVILILDSKNIKYELIDIAEPGAEEAKDFMQNNSTALGGTIGDPNPRHAMPPQIFNDDTYCGDYDMFDMANEIDEMEKFLKLEPSETPEPILKNGEVSKDEIAPQEPKGEEKVEENEVPNEQNESKETDDRESEGKAENGKEVEEEESKDADE